MLDPTIFWFRRDLRLADNPALAAAAADGPIQGVFVIDPVLWGPAGEARRAFLGATLTSLDESMGHRLTVLDGDPAVVLAELAAEIGAPSLMATADFGPYGTARDQKVSEAFDAAGGVARFVDSPYAVAPGTVVNKSGSPYKVFTPFSKAWQLHGWDAPIDAPEVDWRPAPAGTAVADHDWPESPIPVGHRPPAGEEAALDRLDEFLDAAISDYAAERDLPAVDGTSRLSPYLKWGSIHPRQILERLGSSTSEDTYRSELAWREFYADVLHHRPDSARSALNRSLAGIELDDGSEGDARFEAWAEGRTGYPIVDAGMRQLRDTGWMHNRVRMLVGSFLVKDLHLDWTRGARWFMRHLVDGDLASNSHGWQWVAGTGTDAAPYFRIFNPTTQGKKFDPDGTYVRRWVPELADVPTSHVHEPWKAPQGPPAGYPAPIVDHAAERLDALARYERAKNDS